MMFFVFKQKTAYEMRISDWSSDVCSSDLHEGIVHISARREMRSELIVMVDTRAAGDDESVERPDLVLDEQRPGFASQLVRVDIAGDIVLRADTRCLGVDILSTDRRGVPVGRGNGQDRKSTRLHSSH